MKIGDFKGNRISTQRKSSFFRWLWFLLAIPTVLLNAKTKKVFSKMFEKVFKTSIRFDRLTEILCNGFSFLGEKFSNWLNSFFFLIEWNNELNSIFFSRMLYEALSVEATNHQSSFVITDARSISKLVWPLWLIMWFIYSQLRSLDKPWNWTRFKYLNVNTSTLLFSHIRYWCLIANTIFKRATVEINIERKETKKNSIWTEQNQVSSLFKESFECRTRILFHYFSSF